MNETVSKKDEEGRKKSGSPSAAAGPASFWPSGANCWPPYPPSQVPRTVPSHTWSHSNQLRALPDRENPSSRTGRPQLAATTSLKRDLWGTRGHEGKKKVRCGKRFEVEKGGGRRTVHPSVPVVPRAAWSGEWREMSL